MEGKDEKGGRAGGLAGDAAAYIPSWRSMDWIDGGRRGWFLLSSSSRLCSIRGKKRDDEERERSSIKSPGRRFIPSVLLPIATAGEGRKGYRRPFPGKKARCCSWWSTRPYPGVWFAACYSTRTRFFFFSFPFDRHIHQDRSWVPSRPRPPPPHRPFPQLYL